jgi:hypothetical protein
MSFPTIKGVDSPEDYCWELNLAETQELRAVDDREAEVLYTDPEHHRALSIEAEPAHAADGAEVPTTLAVVQSS